MPSPPKRIHAKLSITSLLASTETSQSNSARLSPPQETDDLTTKQKLTLIRHKLLDLLSILQTSPTFRIDEISQTLDVIICELNEAKHKTPAGFDGFQSDFAELENISLKCYVLLEERERLQEYVGEFHRSLLTDRQALVIDVLTQDIMSEREYMGSKKKKLEKEKVKLLEAWYGGHSTRPYLTEQTLSDLVQHTGLSKTQIRNWVSNKRRKERTGSVSSELSILLDPSSDIKGGAF